ncbi:hypothetical protein E4T38_09326 [Aureobasidium subglaciale]|nr:hypothetical protein E4T38_09326 [Aureobasidium subglaciale]KAI5213997.1 hypothetical protein E4T40_09277 [Aureobasidium subglaciale]KAI5216412.1 hypothetical protein E4T41_09278 [Aureobasidium subglaciale]KAI5254207.1 hypothetical protein E4T46_09233 [Aureobasidium subglaciale]
MGVMNHLMVKPNWHKKVFNTTIATKWEQEARALPNFSKRTWRYCLAELRDKADEFNASGISLPIDFDSQVAYSDSSVPQLIVNQLTSAVTALEENLSAYKDWHLGSNGQALDLVHPSLFPLVFGRTRVLKDTVLSLHDCLLHSGEGEICQIPPKLEEYWPLGRPPGYLGPPWLPCEIDIEDPKTATVVSYINNFHPVTHIDLYHIIEKLITAYLPLWNQFLKNTESGLDKSRIDINDFGWHMPYGENSPEDWVDDHNADNEAVLERLALEARFQQTLIVDEEEIIEDSVAGWQRRESKDHHLEGSRWQWATRISMEPEPRGFEMQDTSDTVRLPFDLMRDHKQIQVIVKLAGIHLSPDNPNYSGGSCHVEGRLNEHIVANALFYYDQVNIGPSHLAFRQNVEMEGGSSFSYAHSEFQHLETIMGIDNEVYAVQKLGEVLTKTGRLVACPNVLQHRVLPSALEDPTKPGHSKILAWFLVDPHVKILSIANVPPQQHTWWAKELVQERETSED